MTVWSAVAAVGVALVLVGGAVACNQADNATWQKFVEYGYSQKCGTPAGTTACSMVWTK